MEQHTPCVKPQKQRESPKNIEQALKDVFYVHRNVVRELQREVEQMKANYTSQQTANVKLSEEVKRLQSGCDILTEEKKNLQETINKMKTRIESSVCENCASLQASMSNLQQAYNKALTKNIENLNDQERLIRYLESTVRKKAKLTKAYGSPEVSSGESDSRSETDDMETEKPTKLSLLRRNVKKSRYTEPNKCSASSYKETSPPLKNKHLRKQYTENENLVQSKKNEINKKLESFQTHTHKSGKVFVKHTRSESEKDDHKNETNTKSKSFQTENEVFSKSKVFITESCDSNKSFNVGRKRKRLSNIFVESDIFRHSDSGTEMVPETEFVIVPETLGMGLTSEESEGDTDTQETVKAFRNDQRMRDVLKSPESNLDESCESPTRGGNVINGRNMNVSCDSSDVEYRDTVLKLNKEVSPKQKNESRVMVPNQNRNIMPEKNDARASNLHKKVSPKQKNETSIAISHLHKNISPKQKNETSITIPHIHKNILPKQKNETSGTASDINKNVASKDKKETGFHSTKRSHISKGRQLISESEYLEGCPCSPVFIGTKSPVVRSPSMFDEDEMENRDKNLPNLTVNDPESPLLVHLSRNENEIPYGKNTHTNLVSPLYKTSKEMVDLTFSPQSVSATKMKNKKQKSDLQNSPLKKSNGKSRKDFQHQSLEFISRRSTSTDRLMRQSTLSQAFVPNLSQRSLSPPTKPDEQADIEKAIRLSLQEIQNTVCDERNNGENIRPLFKVPESPIKIVNKHRKIGNSKSEISPKTAKMSASNRGIDNFDETMSPENICMSVINQMDTSVHVVAPLLNGSLDPDFTLTQFCKDDEMEAEHSPSVDAKIDDMKNGRKCSKNEKILNKKCVTDKELEKRDRKKRQIINEKLKPCETEVEQIRKEELKQYKTDYRPINVDVTNSVGKKNKEKHFKKKRQKNTSTCESDTFNDSRVETSHDDHTLDSLISTTRMNRSVEEESQSLPSSSRSYKFGSVKRLQLKRTSPTEKNKFSPDADDDSDEENTLKDVENSTSMTMVTETRKSPDGENGSTSAVRRNSLEDSFDRVPRKKDVDYAYVDVVRKKQERKNLQATTCQECYEYYKSTGMSEDEIKKKIHDCSRHRARHLQPSTPEHFWSIGFPDTQECHERGYIHEETPSRAKPSAYRRRRKLEKRFKSKNEEDDHDTQDKNMSDTE